MDGERGMRTHSLRSYLKRWLVFSTLSISFVVVIIVGLISYIDAKDTQDEILAHVINIVNRTNLNEETVIGDFDKGCSSGFDFYQETAELLEDIGEVFGLGTEKREFGEECEFYDDTKLIVEEVLERPSPILGVTESIKDGLHTINSSGGNWRALVASKKNGRFIVAQQTEVRDGIVVDAVVSSMVPIFILSLVLLFTMNWIVSYLFSPLREVSNKLDQQNPIFLEPVFMENKIEEISPFVEAINRLILRVNEHSQAEKKFISYASHELRTPISAIYLQFGNLENAQSEEERKKRIVHLKRGIEQVRKLLEQLLDLSKVQIVGLSKEEYFSLNEIVEEIITLLYPLAEEKDIDLGLNQNNSSGSRRINHAVSQILSNAISNAIQHTPNEGKIDISVHEEENGFTFTVEDSGPGIPVEEREAVLSAFYSVKDSKSSGTGLGLTISNEIARRLGGVISLSESHLGGLNFTYSQKLK